MEHDRIDQILRSLAERPSRRLVLAGLTVGLLAGLPDARFNDAAEARNKHKNKKRRKKQRHPQEAPNPVPEGPSQPASPPPPAPVTTIDAVCHSTNTTSLSNVQRIAQTFQALRSGQLTSASVTLLDNFAGATFVMEIRSVDAAGTPAAVLTSTTIANLNATTGGLERIITGVFASPATVVAGERYALAVTETPYLGYSIQASTTDPCSDGNLFFDIAATGAFNASAIGDLMFDIFVTA